MEYKGEENKGRKHESKRWKGWEGGMKGGKERKKCQVLRERQQSKIYEGRKS